MGGKSLLRLYASVVDDFQLIDKVLSGDASELRIADTDRCIVELMRNVSGLNETLILRRAERLPQ